MKSFFPQICADCIHVRNVEDQPPPASHRTTQFQIDTVHELRIWEDPADRVLMIEQLQRGGPIRNVITRLRTKSGEVKLTAYSADRIQFDGQSCILAVSEDLPEYDKGKVN